MNQDIVEKYTIGSPESWSPSIRKDDILELIKESDFSQQQYDDGRDFCYFVHKTVYTDDTKNSEYVCMAYSVQQPSTLDFASVNEYILLSSEQVTFHTIAVIRDGVWIDKLPDTKFKVLDNENDSIDGVINSSKKVNYAIKDVRLHDILIIEDTRTLFFTSKDFLRKELYKYIWISPDVYWGYGKYQFELINNRSKAIAFKKLFFRDEQGELMPEELGRIEPKTNHSFILENYLNPVDVNREVYPFIDYATEYNYKDLLGLVYQYYHEAYHTQPLKAYASDLVEKLDGFEDQLDKKIQYAIEYVQNNIRYIYNEEEMHGHRPQMPWDTYTSKQGDCKAKTVLLKSILDYLDVDSEVILVNFGADFYIKHYLPSLFNFNHVILKINYKGQEYFEDATIKDEYGQLGHRSLYCFANYLPIREESELMRRNEFVYPDFGFEDDVLFDVKDGEGFIKIISTYKYGRANQMRRYYKNTNKKVIIDNTNSYIYDCLSLREQSNENDKRKIFVDTQLNVLKDDRDLNVYVLEYTSKISTPYNSLAEKDKVLKYYDGSIVKLGVRDHVQKDIMFLQCYDPEKYTITIRSDKPIVQNDQITNQELNLDSRYFKFKNKKDIQKHQATATITFEPVTNIEIPFEDLESARENYNTITKSHYGLGILIGKPGLMERLKSLFN